MVTAMTMSMTSRGKRSRCCPCWTAVLSHAGDEPLQHACAFGLYFGDHRSVAKADELARIGLDAASQERSLSRVRMPPLADAFERLSMIGLETMINQFASNNLHPLVDDDERIGRTLVRRANRFGHCDVLVVRALSARHGQIIR